MTSRRTHAKPCRIRVTAWRNSDEFEHRYAKDWGRSHATIFRSVREARRNILHATTCMNSHSRAWYTIDLETLDGEVIPVRECVVDFVVAWNRWDEYHNSIGARLRRGEMVAV